MAYRRDDLYLSMLSPKWTWFTFSNVDRLERDRYLTTMWRTHYLALSQRTGVGARVRHHFEFGVPLDRPTPVDQGGKALLNPCPAMNGTLAHSQWDTLSDSTKYTCIGRISFSIFTVGHLLRS